MPDHSTFSKNRHGRFRDSNLLREVFEIVVRRCIAEGLVGGSDFASDASLIRADAEKLHSLPPAQWDNGQIGEEVAPRAMREYLETLDDAAFGAATDVRPKFISCIDPASQWTAALNGPAIFAYSVNYLIDTDNAVIVDVDASRSIRQAEVGATRAMVGRTKDIFDLQPELLAADTAYGSGDMLGWLDDRQITPHIPVFDKTDRTDGTFPNPGADERVDQTFLDFLEYLDLRLSSKLPNTLEAPDLTYTFFGTTADLGGHDFQSEVLNKSITYQNGIWYDPYNYAQYNLIEPFIGIATAVGEVHLYGVHATSWSATANRAQNANTLFVPGVRLSAGEYILGYWAIPKDQDVSGLYFPDLGIVINSDFGEGGTQASIRDILSSSILDLLGGDRVEIDGSELADRILLGDRSGNIHSDGGDDFVVGGVGADVISGGDGNDTINGDDGNDVLYGDAGRDSLIGGDGNDTLWGHADNDTLLGGGGDDAIWDEQGDDSLLGGIGYDQLGGGDGNDTISGDDGNDVLYGDAGRDSLIGGDGNDTLWGQDESDSLYGSSGSDVLQGGTGVDALFGGGADDFLYVGQQTALVDGSETQGGHSLFGGTGNDVLDAWSNDGGQRDLLFGGGGNDRFHVQDGDEIKDMGRGDEAWVLNARPADWMVATALGPDVVAVSFHNRRLGAVTELRIEGAVAPALFDVRYEFGGSITVLATGAADAASRAQKVGFSEVLSRTVDALRNDVVPVGWELVGGVGGAEAISRLMIDKAEDILPGLTRQIGEKAAKGFIELAGGIAGAVGGSVTKHLLGDFDAMSDREIALQYVQDIGGALLTYRMGILVAGAVGVTSLPVWGSLAVGASVVVGVKVAERFFETWFDAVEQTLQAEADPQNISESIYFRPIDPAPMEVDLLF